MHFSYQLIVVDSLCHRIPLVNDNELISDMSPWWKKMNCHHMSPLVNDHELILYMNTLVNDTELILYMKILVNDTELILCNESE